MEMEEAEDEEWDTGQYYSERNAINCGKVRWVCNKGLRIGKQILVAGFVASSVPLVLPPLVVASAIGLAVSMPYAFFLASHACTQSIMSKLLPGPSPQDPQMLKAVCFQPDVDIIYREKDEQAHADETNRDNEMVDVPCMKNGENLTLGNDCGLQEEDATDVIQRNGCEKCSSGFLCEEEEEASLQEDNDVILEAKIDDGLEGYLREESNGVQPMSDDHGVDKIGNEIEEFKPPFEVTRVTNVVLEEFQDQAIEGEIEESELQRETKGLLEKIRDEGRTDRTQERGEYAEGRWAGANENDQKIGPVIEEMEVVQENRHSFIIEGTEGNLRNEEDPHVGEEMLQSENDESKDTICNEVESDEHVRGLLEGKQVDNTNDLKKPITEPSELLDGSHVPYETILAEQVGDLLTEIQVYNISVDEDSYEVVCEKTDIHTVPKEEPLPPDGPTTLQKGKLDNNNSDFLDQESQLHEYNEVMDPSVADAREIANESALDLFDKKIIEPEEFAYTIDWQESSNVDGHTDSMEVLVSSIEQESGPSECSSGKNIIYPSQEGLYNEENIWKQIHLMRKIVGYEGTTQASCIEELKALYIFTGVEPPTFVNENSCDPAEINEKLHFLMSIVGIKSNMA